MENKNVIWRTLAVFAVVVSAITLIALCFFEWKSPEVYSQGMAIVVSAALGAILTAIITRMVIGSQLKSEQEKEKNIKIYEMKLEVYSKFISEMWKLLDDEKIDDTELLHLRSELFNKLLFMLQDKDVKRLEETINKLRLYANDDINNIIAVMGEITKILSYDIMSQTVEEHESNNIDKNPFVSLWNAFSNKSFEDKESPITNPTLKQINIIENSNRQYWHMNMVDSSKQRKALIDGTNELSLIEYEEEGKRTQLLKQVQKGDLIFLYNKGSMFLGIFEAIGRRIFYYENETLKEELVEILGGPAKIFEDEKIIKDDEEKYDIYGGIKDDAYFCSNLIVKPLACMLMPKDEDVAAYRPTICRYWKDYGDSILNKYKEALETNNEEFGKIDGEVINCDTETFKNLFK